MRACMDCDKMVTARFSDGLCLDCVHRRQRRQARQDMNATLAERGERAAVGERLVFGHIEIVADPAVPDATMYEFRGGGSLLVVPSAVFDQVRRDVQRGAIPMPPNGKQSGALTLAALERSIRGSIADDRAGRSVRDLEVENASLKAQLAALKNPAAWGPDLSPTIVREEAPGAT